jgi:hypothetical protein
VRDARQDQLPIGASTCGHVQVKNVDMTPPRREPESEQRCNEDKRSSTYPAGASRLDPRNLNL